MCIAFRKEIKGQIMKDLIAEIQKYKAERQAVILAHNYVRSEIQDIADFVGDSLQLSVEAEKLNAPVIVMCGVKFMGETVKLLSPKSLVLLPRFDAGCPMADMANGADVLAYRNSHPETTLIAYVNTTAEVKAQVDICCTSGNAEQIVKSLPKNKKIMFLPDGNLGKNLNISLNRNMELWPGCCPIHNQITPEMIKTAQQLRPGVKVLIHPECTPAAVAVADFSLSTGGMLKFVRTCEDKEFIIATETGILHRLRKENPDKKFYPINPEPICADMKKITLDDVLYVLKTLENRVELSPEVAVSSLASIQAMLQI